jgi:hypothetical protein
MTCASHARIPIFACPARARGRGDGHCPRAAELLDAFPSARGETAECRTRGNPRRSPRARGSAILVEDARRVALVFRSTAAGRPALPDVGGDGAKRASLTRWISAGSTRGSSGSRQTVDLVVLDEAPRACVPGLRDGRVILERDRALVERRARAILEYLDFQPIEELCARGALEAAAHGRPRDPR